MLQNKVLEAEQQILKIDHSIEKSLRVADIFQDRIPHQEIVERQQKIEYVRAARLAHNGVSVDEIAKQVSLPREQIELIAKFNREQLMFDEEQLPEWAHRASANVNEMDFLGNAEKPKPDLQQMARIGDNFKQAVETVKQQDIAAQQSLMDSRMGESIRNSMASGVESMQPAVMSIRATAQTLKDKLVSTAEDMLRNQAAMQSMPTVIKSEANQVKKVIFPRLDSHE